MGGNEFGVDVRLVDGQVLLALRGDVDAYTGPSLTDHLNSAVAEGVGDVTLNLEQVKFVDSSGIAVLVAAAKQLRQRGDDLIVQSPPATVHKVLEITGVTRLLRVEHA